MKYNFKNGRDDRFNDFELLSFKFTVKKNK